MSTYVSRASLILVVACGAASHVLTVSGQVIPASSSKSTIVECNQNTFFDAVSSADSKRAFALMHPALRELVDEPVFKTWTSALNKTLGSVQSIEDVDSSEQQKPTGIEKKSKAKVVFEKGQATSTISTLNGKLVSFNVVSPQMKDWFKGPADTEMYENHGSGFIRKFLTDDIGGAYEMCHPALQEQTPVPTLKDMVKKVLDHGGPLKSIEMKHKSMELTPNSQKLFIKYSVECEKTTIPCEITFRFIGMQGHMTGFQFNFKPDE